MTLTPTERREIKDRIIDLCLIAAGIAAVVLAVLIAGSRLT